MFFIKVAFTIILPDHLHASVIIKTMGLAAAQFEMEAGQLFEMKVRQFFEMEAGQLFEMGAG